MNCTHDITKIAIFQITNIFKVPNFLSKDAYDRNRFFNSFLTLLMKSNNIIVIKKLLTDRHICDQKFLVTRNNLASLIYDIFLESFIKCLLNQLQNGINNEKKKLSVQVELNQFYVYPFYATRCFGRKSFASHHFTEKRCIKKKCDAKCRNMENTYHSFKGNICFLIYFYIHEYSFSCFSYIVFITENNAFECLNQMTLIH